MATRYAVTTGNWNGAIWAATATGAAGSAAVPTTSDDVNIGRQILLSNVVIATNVFSSTAHGLVDGDIVWVTTVNNAITPLSPFTDYYVISSSANDFKLSLTPGGAEIDITSTGSGNRYVIPKVTVSLDNTTCVANTVTVNSILSTLTTADTTLTTQRGITQAIGSFASFDVSASAYIHTILMNESNNATAYGYYVPTGAKYTFHGKAKTRWTKVNGATSASDTSFAVDDATGWATGDRLMICTTQAWNTTPKVDYLQNVTVTGTTIDLTGATPSSLAYAHADNAYIGNFSSNIRIGVSTVGYKSYFYAVSIPNSTMQYASNTVSDVEFFDLYGYTASPNASLYFNGTPTGCSLEFTNNAIYNASHCIYGSFNGTLTMNNNVYAMHNATIQNNTSMIHTNHFIENTINDTDSIFFGGTGGQYAMSSVQNRTGTMTRLRFSGYSSSSGRATVFGSGADNSVIFESCAWWSNGQDVGTSYNAWPAILYRNCTFGTEFSGANSSRTFGVDYPARNRFENCTLGTPDALFYGANQGTWGNTVLLNKNDDTTVQETYTGESYTIPTFSRDNSVYNRSLSSLKIFGTTYGVDRDHKVDILVAGSATITIVGYIQVDSDFYNGGTWYAPTAIVKQGDTVLDTFTATSAANGAWEKIELSATNPSASTKVLTLYLRANRYGSAGFCWFTGMPFFPYINACRHYGYLFDETSITRTVNPTIDTAISEATAIGYGNSGTDLEVTWGATSSLAVKVDSTFKKIYHFTQADACLQIASALPLTGTGTDDVPSLSALGDITVSATKTLNGPGSIDMGAKTLTGTTPFAYTYTGGVFSQATTVPSFSGGTLNIGEADSYSFTQLAGMILSMTPTAPGTYLMGSNSYTGQIDLRNTTAHAITVELPTGTSYTTANNTGGTITVSLPSVTCTINLSGFVSGTRIQIYDTLNTVELFNDVVAATTKVYTETYSVDRTIRVRASYVSGATAKMFTEQNLGALNSTTNTISRDLEQVADSVYDDNAVDGSAVTGITFTDSATDIVNCDIVDGSTTWQDIYAAFAYWMFTAGGIADDIAYVTAVDTANYRLTSMKIKNTSSPTAPLEITGGYGVDDTTGASIDLVDTTGGTLIFAPDHVVAKVVTVGGVNTITGDITEIPGYVQSGLTAQGLTTTRAGKLDNLDMSIIASTQA